MRLKSRLAEWQENDLISARQTRDIIAFEKLRVRDLFQTGLKFTALFAILLGVSLIVAANWDLFSVHIRLGAHIVLNIIVAVLIWRWHDKPHRRRHKEGAVYALSGLTLTLLALIGQSFHLQGDIGGLLMLWIALITGMVIMAGDHERVTRMWLIGFGLALLSGIETVTDKMTEPFVTFFILSLAALLPLAMWCDGHIRHLRRINTPFADTLSYGGFVGAVITGFGASFLYYQGAYDIIRDTGLDVGDFYMYLSVLAGITAIGFFAARRFFAAEPDLMVIALCTVFLFMPFVFAFESSIAAAIHFIALALCLGFFAYHDGHDRMVSLCLLAISLRLFIIFTELFGTMLMTGWGMIFAGVLLFGIVHVTRKLQHHLINREKNVADHA